jgi:NADH:ubiquinone oxidoreductase subunit K
MGKGADLVSGVGFEGRWELVGGWGDGEHCQKEGTGQRAMVGSRSPKFVTPLVITLKKKSNASHAERHIGLTLKILTKKFFFYKLDNNRFPATIRFWHLFCWHFVYLCMHSVTYAIKGGPMKRQTAIVVVLMLCIALMLSGCTMAITGSAKVQQGSFGEQKRLAVVTIAAGKEFSGEQGFFQTFKKNEDIKGLDTQPVIDELMPVIRKKFAQTGYYTSVPMKNIVNSTAYLDLQEDERVQKLAFFKNELNVAKGYKYFNDPQKLARLAQELKVDGVICVMMNFTVESMKSSVYLAMVTFGKKEYAANVAISVIAYDREGNVLWKDSTIKQAEPGDKNAIVLMDFSDFANTDFEKMHPSAVLIGGYAVDVIVQRFKDTMEGKGTSVFQRVRDQGTKQATNNKT